MLKLATKFAPSPLSLKMAYRAGYRYAELWLDARKLSEWQTVLRLTRDYPNGYALHSPNRLDASLEATLEGSLCCIATSKVSALSSTSRCSTGITTFFFGWNPGCGWPSITQADPARVHRLGGTEPRFGP